MPSLNSRRVRCAFRHTQSLVGGGDKLKVACSGTAQTEEEHHSRCRVHRRLRPASTEGQGVHLHTRWLRFTALPTPCCHSNDRRKGGKPIALRQTVSCPTWYAVCPTSTCINAWRIDGNTSRKDSSGNRSSNCESFSRSRARVIRDWASRSIARALSFVSYNLASATGTLPGPKRLAKPSGNHSGIPIVLPKS